MSNPTKTEAKEPWKSQIDMLYDGERSRVKRAKEDAQAVQTQRILKRYQSEYYCHVCEASDRGPAVPFYAQQEASQVKPSDLKKCEWCHRWTCSEHLYRGICSDCAAHQPLGIKVNKWLGRKYLDEKELQKSPGPSASPDPAGPAAVREPQTVAESGFWAYLQRATARLRSDWGRLRKVKSAP